MRVLTWNLKHGRAVPPAGRELLDEFASTLDGWAWDVALLQEVPPWWPAHLPGEQRAVAPVSRLAFGAARRAVARRRPDLIGANAGQANAILLRGGLRFDVHARRRLRVWPERRVVHAVRLTTGTWIANTHCQGGGRPDRSRVDLRAAAATVARWAGPAAAVFGGDLNLRREPVPGFTTVAREDVDHVCVRGAARAVGRGTVLERGALSDHAPLAIDLEVPR